MTIIDLTEYRQSKQAHIQGPAICLGCGHKWQAVVPVPVPDDFECPACALEKGVYRGMICPPPDDNMIFRCNCGNIRFMTQAGGMFCECCGVLHTWDGLLSEL